MKNRKSVILNLVQNLKRVQIDKANTFQTPL